MRQLKFPFAAAPNSSKAQRRMKGRENLYAPRDTEGMEKTKTSSGLNLRVLCIFVAKIIALCHPASRVDNKSAPAVLFFVGEDRFLPQIRGWVRESNPGAATAEGRMKRQLPNGINPKCTQKSYVQSLLLTAMEAFLQDSRLQNVQRVQRPNRVQVRQKGGKFAGPMPGDGYVV